MTKETLIQGPTILVKTMRSAKLVTENIGTRTKKPGKSKDGCIANIIANNNNIGPLQLFPKHQWVLSKIPYSSEWRAEARHFSISLENIGCVVCRRRVPRAARRAPRCERRLPRFELPLTGSNNIVVVYTLISYRVRFSVHASFVLLWELLPGVEEINYCYILLCLVKCFPCFRPHRWWWCINSLHQLKLFTYYAVIT